MPRKQRMYLPGVPCHVVQRGNDRCACFYSDDDYRVYLLCLDDARQRYSVDIHAYVLMTNHVHLLMTPTTIDGISRLMQLLGNRYVQYINKTYRRTGTLWEGRHKSSLIDAENYLLACYRYIELNPVRADMVKHPGDYCWSSYRHHAYGDGDLNPLIKEHEVYNRIASSTDERRHAYRELFSVNLDSEDIHRIRNASTFSMPLGDQRFKEQIEEMLGRKIGHDKYGRPTHA